MNDKEITTLGKKSLITIEFSHKNKDNITTAELSTLCTSIKKHLRLKKDFVVMTFEVKK